MAGKVRPPSSPLATKADVSVRPRCHLPRRRRCGLHCDVVVVVVSSSGEPSKSPSRLDRTMIPVCGARKALTLHFPPPCALVATNFVLNFSLLWSKISSEVPSTSYKLCSVRFGVQTENTVVAVSEAFGFDANLLRRWWKEGRSCDSEAHVEEFSIQYGYRVEDF